MAEGGTVRPALNPGSQRVFYALWPDADVRADLARAGRRMHQLTHGRCVREHNIHLTLAFIGAVSSEKLTALTSPPAHILRRSFLLTLDNWGCWAGTGIGWAAPSHVPEGLLRLSANLAAWLLETGFEAELRRFTPHITLVRNARRVPQLDPLRPIQWQVRKFALIDSLLTPSGPRYQELASWTLE